MKVTGPIRFLALLCVPMILLSATKGGAQESPQTATAEAHLGKGYDALKNDRYDVAADEFRAALGIDPKLTLRARFPLAVALFELHKAEEARTEFETIRKETGDHPNVLYYLGRLDLDASNFDNAIRELTAAAEKPPFPDTFYYLGFAHLKHGDLPEAEKWLTQAAQASPNDARVSYQLGQVYRRQGREEEAKKQFALSDELRRKDDSDSQLRSECARKLDEGNRDEAHSICDQLYDANDADKLTALGTLYGQHGDLRAALKDFARAAELSPQSPQTQYNLALVYYQLNQFEQARIPLRNALQRWPDLFQLNALYGAVLVKLGDDEEAYPALQRAYQVNPQDAATAELLYATALRNAARCKAAQQYSEALRFLTQAARIRPDDPEPHHTMAEIYRQSGSSAKAKAEQAEADRLAGKIRPK